MINRFRDSDLAPQSRRQHYEDKTIGGAEKLYMTARRHRTVENLCADRPPERTVALIMAAVSIGVKFLLSLKFQLYSELLCLI